MLNQSADYALRAVLYVAQRHGESSCSARTIADALGVPQNYLGKVLNTLTSAGVLTSTRGPRGGFRLTTSPDRVTIADVAGPFQPLPTRSMCLMGDRPCDPANPCSAHGHWQSITDRVTDFFRKTTIAVMLDGDAAGVLDATSSHEPISRSAIRWEG